MHDNYLYDFEYFYLTGDDTHLIVENLRNYLGLIEEDLGSNSTLFVGQQHYRKEMEYFAGGGGGYVLNRLTLKHLVEEIFPVCFENTMDSAEDVLVSKCLQRMDVRVTDAADARGGQRFHCMDAHYVEKCGIEGCPGPKRYWNLNYRLWAKKHGYKTGIDLVSTQSVSFHFLRYEAFMKRHHAILYRSCPTGTLLADQLEQMDKSTA